VQAPFYDSLIAMAPPAQGEILAMMRPDPARVTMIYNPALPTLDGLRLARLRNATPRHHAGRHYLGIGRLVRQKNFALLIDSFADIAGPDDRLTILGEGPKRAQLEALARRRGVAGRVALPGHCADIAPHLAAADAFVLSSDYEGLGVVVVEALTAGLPVVATNCSVNMPWLVDGLGWRVPVRDRRALGDAMQAAVCGPASDMTAIRARTGAFDVATSVQHWLAHLVAVAGLDRPSSLGASARPCPS
jgi:glycosyltransferase involved in cell wall biosynthesis